MKITRIETFAKREAGVVRVTAEDGSVGYGQVSTFNADIAATVLHRQIAQHVLGADHLDVTRISERCIEANLKYPWSYVCRALCGVDTALWDMRGRIEQTSVCELLGGTPRPFPAY